MNPKIDGPKACPKDYATIFIPLSFPELSLCRVVFIIIYNDDDTKKPQHTRKNIVKIKNALI